MVMVNTIREMEAKLKSSIVVHGWTTILFASDDKPKIKCNIILILNNDILNIFFSFNIIINKSQFNK